MSDRKKYQEDWRLITPLYFAVCLFLTILLHFIYPIEKFIPFPYNLTGIILIIIGSWLNVWADNVFKKSDVSVKPFAKPTTLINEGPFAVSRHPMYLGMLMIILGAAVILGSVMAFIGAVLFIIIIEIVFIPLEEKNMMEIFDEEYKTYKKKVRRWI